METIDPSNVKELKASKNVKGLIEALENEDWYVRMCAAVVLGEIGDKRAMEPLTSALKDRSRDIRRSTAMALEKIKAKES